MNQALHFTSLKNFTPLQFSDFEIDKRIKVVSLFSGCGGMDLGLRGGFDFLGEHYQRNSFDIIWANDFNAAACRSYKRNIGPEIICGDIWKLLPQIPSIADIVVGGFPCQDISVNGKGLGVDGPKSGLYRAMVKVVEKIQPKIFIAENVKGLLMKHNKDSLSRVIEDFSNLGYDVSYYLFQAADYGVPQTRERVIIIGTLPSIKKFVAPPKVKSEKQWVTAKDAISDLAHVEENASFSHVWSRAKRSPDQGGRQLRADRAAYTMRAECHGNIQFHYDLDRRISMREAARFQSFPDDFVFDAKLRETERQVGNAVPPVLAWHIAQSVENMLDVSAKGS